MTSPAERWPDPAKAYKFRVQIVGAHGDSLEIGFMSVAGLQVAMLGGQLQLTRGVCKDHNELFDWFMKRDLRDVVIVVDGQITFRAENCKPTTLHFNDLDAGADNRHILVEMITVEYKSLTPEYNAPYL
jgi:hypothetical protein